MTALRFQAEASEILKSSLERATPEGVKASKAVGGGGGSMGEMAVKNAQAKIDTTQAMFENQAKRHKNACDDLLNTERILNETLNRLATTDATLESLDKIMEMLKEGLILLGKLKQQWASLSEFFSSMANLIKMAAEQTTKFVDISQVASRNPNRISMGEITKNQIYTYARESVTIGYVVQRLAKGYVEVSRNHLMDPIARLPSMLALDAETDKSKINSQKNYILKKCTAAQQAIKYMIDDEKKDFKRDLDSRMNVISQEFGKLTSSLSPAQKQEIKETVEDGIENALEVMDEEDEFV